jgi:hypothetical protein
MVLIAYRQPDHPHAVTDLSGYLGLAAQAKKIYFIAMPDQRLRLSLDASFALRIVIMDDHTVAFTIH